MLAAFVSSLLLLSGVLADTPWFCRNYECPEFQSVEKHDEYELREYQSAKWVGINVEDSYDKAYKAAYAKLYRYMSGENADGESIDMTTPVTMIMKPKEGGGFEKNYTMSFYLPARFQEDAPEPNDRHVHVVDIPAFEAYVYSYGGYTSEKDILAKSAILFKMLHDAGEEVETEMYISATYDNPLRVVNRHNEIWLVKKKKEDDNDDKKDDMDLLVKKPLRTAENAIRRAKMWLNGPQ